MNLIMVRNLINQNTSTKQKMEQFTSICPLMSTYKKSMSIAQYFLPSILVEEYLLVCMTSLSGGNLIWKLLRSLVHTPLYLEVTPGVTS